MRRLSRRILATASAAAIALSGLAIASTPAHAESAGFMTLTKEVTGWNDGHQVGPGDTFNYTIVITCSNSGTGGCTNAQFADAVPDGLIVKPPVSVTGSAHQTTVDGNQVTVDFTADLTDPSGGHGLEPQATVTITIPVQVDPNLPATASGDPLKNTGTVTADNADTM